jgi:hypothetical protein
VIVSHGEPVHDRATFELALASPPDEAEPDSATRTLATVRAIPGAIVSAPPPKRRVDEGARAGIGSEERAGDRAVPSTCRRAAHVHLPGRVSTNARSPGQRPGALRAHDEREAAPEQCPPGPRDPRALVVRDDEPDTTAKWRATASNASSSG